MRPQKRRRRRQVELELLDRIGLGQLLEDRGHLHRQPVALAGLHQFGHAGQGSDQRRHGLGLTGTGVDGFHQLVETAVQLDLFRARDHTGEIAVDGKADDQGRSQ